MFHTVAVPIPRVSDAEHPLRLPSLTAHDRETLRTAVQWSEPFLILLVLVMDF
jgi:hypothetical protein